MRFSIVLGIATCLLVLAQKSEPKRPDVLVNVVPPEAVPVGPCKQDEFGYLDISDGHNHWRPYGPAELGAYLTDRAEKGFVVATTHNQKAGCG
jgi:hypothetical protein